MSYRRDEHTTPEQEAQMDYDRDLERLAELEIAGLETTVDELNDEIQALKDKITELTEDTEGPDLDMDDVRRDK